MSIGSVVCFFMLIGVSLGLLGGCAIYIDWICVVCPMLYWFNSIPNNKCAQNYLLGNVHRTVC